MATTAKWVWASWTSTSDSSSTGFDTTWDSWNTPTTSSTTTDNSSGGTVWYTWVSTDSGGTGDVSVEYNGAGTWSTWISKEDRKRQERAERRRSEPRRFAGGLTDREKADLRAEKAEKKAKDLLLELIGEDELKVYEETGRLFVKGKKYDYVIRRDKLIGGLERIGKDKILDLCVHLKSEFKCPKTDNVIALKLAIENDEKNVLRLANDYGSRERPEELPIAACM